MRETFNNTEPLETEETEDGYGIKINIERAFNWLVSISENDEGRFVILTVDELRQLVEWTKLALPNKPEGGDKL